MHDRVFTRVEVNVDTSILFVSDFPGLFNGYFDVVDLKSWKKTFHFL